MGELVKGKHLLATLSVLVMAFAAGCSSSNVSSSTTASGQTTTSVAQAPTTAPQPTPTPKPQSGCKADGEDTSTWTTLRDIPTPSDAPAIPNIGEGPGQVRPQQTKPVMPNPKSTNNGCFDTIVLDIPVRDLDGTNKVWFDGQYVKEVTGGGSDNPIPGLKGNAHIQLVIWAPTMKSADGFPLYEDGAYDIEDTTGYGALREFKLVSDYEGYTTFAIGTEAETPYAIEYRLSKGQTLEVVVMIAHH